MENSFNRKDMEIFFVRHGESYGNVELDNVPEFKTDNPPLTPNGLRQAELLANRFAKGDIDRIFSSALIRTAQTVQPVAEKLGLHVTMMPDLNETDTRIVSADEEEILQKAPNAIPFKGECEPVGFESEEKRLERAKRCMEFLLGFEGEKLLVATHGTFYRSLMRCTLGMCEQEPFYFKVRNCSVTHIIFSREKIPAVNAANDISHLNPYGE